MHSIRHSLFAVVVLVLAASPTVFAASPTTQRRVLYNFDGDSCLATKAGSKGPVPVSADDVKRLIEEAVGRYDCDVPAWVKHGWVDFVTVSEFLLERGDLPISLWKQAITTVPVYSNITSWRWDFGDGKTSSERHPTHGNEKAGEYIVTLRVEGPDGKARRAKVWDVTLP